MPISVYVTHSKTENLWGKLPVSVYEKLTISFKDIKSSGKLLLGVRKLCKSDISKRENCAF